MNGPSTLKWGWGMKSSSGGGDERQYPAKEISLLCAEETVEVHEVDDGVVHVSLAAHAIPDCEALNTRRPKSQPFAQCRTETSTCPMIFASESASSHYGSSGITHLALALYFAPPPLFPFRSRVPRLTFHCTSEEI